MPRLCEIWWQSYNHDNCQWLTGYVEKCVESFHVKRSNMLAVPERTLRLRLFPWYTLNGRSQIKGKSEALSAWFCHHFRWNDSVLTLVFTDNSQTHWEDTPIPVTHAMMLCCQVGHKAIIRVVRNFRSKRRLNRSRQCTIWLSLTLVNKEGMSVLLNNYKVGSGGPFGTKLSIFHQFCMLTWYRKDISISLIWHKSRQRKWPE